MVTVKHNTEVLSLLPPGDPTESRARLLARRKAYRMANTEVIAMRRKAARLANLDKYRARDKAYYQTHREKRLAYIKTYVATHYEEVSAYQTDYRQKNAEKLQRYRDLNAEKHNEQAKTYRTTHRAELTEKQRHRRACFMGAAQRDFTTQQWREMQVAYDHRCVYCGKRRKGKLTQDHLTPLRKGGNHTKSNIVPACQSCNSRKSARSVLCPVQPLLL